MAAAPDQAPAEGSPRAGPGLVDAPDRVLATLEKDGRRRWLRPTLSRGRFLAARRAVGWTLIAIYLLVPHLRLGGKPLLLLDVAAREFTLLGTTFGATDTPYLMLLLLAVFVGIFLVTALLGRVWCGWGCPQTVYMELLFRPLERLFEGSPQDQRRLDATGPSLGRLLKNVTFLGVAFVLANTFLAYFVGTERLGSWMLGSPLRHPAAFLLVLGVTAAVFLDFAWFREQTCLVACPYGRFQSALLDRQSLLVAYDPARGEPRGKPGKKGLARLSAGARMLPVAPPQPARPTAGECIDCNACVQTCPVGIDIRDGLQMECIGCAQCVDACDALSDTIGRPRGLIRYMSPAELEGQPRRVVRPRIVAYAVVLTGLVVALGLLLGRRAPAEVTLLRASGAPFVERADGRVQGQVRFKVENHLAAAARFELAVVGPDGAPLDGVEVVLPMNPLPVPARGAVEWTAFVVAPRDRFREGRLAVVLRARSVDGEPFAAELPAVVTGPRGGVR